MQSTLTVVLIISASHWLICGVINVKDGFRVLLHLLLWNRTTQGCACAKTVWRPFWVQACKSGGGWKGLELVKQVLVAALWCPNNMELLEVCCWVYCFSFLMSYCCRSFVEQFVFSRKIVFTGQPKFQGANLLIDLHCLYSFWGPHWISLAHYLRVYHRHHICNITPRFDGLCPGPLHWSSFVYNMHIGFQADLFSI